MSHIENFVKLKNEIIKILTELKNEASKNELSQDLNESIEATIDSINSDKFTVAVVGVIKRGKSTLLNALLKAEKDILSTNVNPETARLSVLTYDEKPRAVIYTLNNKKIDISLDELPEYTSNYDKTLGVKGKSQKVNNTKFAQIFYPNEILKQGFEIVDTPGVEDPDESRSKVTLDFIDKADAAIFLMTASEGGLKNSELQFLKSKILNNEGSSKGIVFVLNKIGQLRRRQLESELSELIKNNESLLQKEFGLQKIKIFHIDALEALKVYRNEIKENEAKFLKQFEEFREYLSNYLVEEKGKIFLKLRINKFIIESLNQKIQNLKKLVIEKPKDLYDIEKQLRDDQNRLEVLTQKLKQVENKYKTIKDELKNSTKRIIIDEFNRIIISKESVQDLNKNLVSKSKSISSKINKKISDFISDLIYEFNDYNLNISKPDFNIPLKQLNMSEFYSVQQIKHEASRDGEAIGKVAGGVLGFLFGGFFPPAIYVGYKLGGYLGSQFDEKEWVEEKVHFDYEGLKREIEYIKEQIINSYYQNIDLYFKNTIENIKGLILQEKRSVESNYKANKKAYNMKTEEFEKYIRELNNLISNICNYKIQLENILLEVQKL